MGPIQGRETARQDGVTLIEILISVVIMSLLVGAATTGIFVLNRTTARANDAARANVLITGFGEALKRLPYVECTRGNLEAEYQDEFEAYQASLPEAQRLLKANESVEVTDVDVPCVPVDPGVQTISFEVSSRTATRTAQVVKRNPEYVDGFFPSFTATRLTPDGDALAIFRLDASGSSPIARIVQYSYACGDDDDTVINVTDPISGDALCEYRAENAVTTRTITLTVTDVAGRTKSTTRDVTIPAVVESRLAPTPVIKASCAPTPSAQCTSGTANPNLVVSFDASSSTSLQGTIKKYEWDFGDVDSGPANTATGVTASHTFSRSNNFQVRLTVTDEIGVSASTTLTIAVTRPGPPPPVARFTFTPSPAVAPQTISFNGTGSTTATGGAVASYAWNFGDGATSSEPTPQRLYSTPGTYNVTLTVQDGAGVASTLTQQVVIGTFQPMPPNFRLTDASGCLLGLFCRGHFYFAWTNGTRSSTDNLDYEIQIRHVSGACFGFNTESKLVRAGAPGTVQTYDYVVGSASDTCIWNTYEWRVRSIRSSSQNGSSTSAWSGWSSWTIGRLAW
jgi:prepilin-type N-terminal cleavage/methylation domain-containing protein